jgi:3-phenylpropionate/trans-cinnamate dioxygenase ferredoxin component
MNLSDPIPVGVLADLQPGQRKLVFVNGRSVVLFNIDGTLHAIDNACPHNGAALAGGKLDGCMLSCPAHGLRFDLRSGGMRDAGGLRLTGFPVQVVDGNLFVRLEVPACNHV